MTKRRSNWNDMRGRGRVGDADAYDSGYEEATLADSIAQLVYDARTAAGITQSDLAERMGTSQSAIARLEGGGGLPSLATLQRLARALELRLHVELVRALDGSKRGVVEAEVQRVQEAVGAAVQSSLEHFAEAFGSATESTAGLSDAEEMGSARHRRP